ncbi:MAG: triose-phosphate isomerase [Gemmatimonadales bacterium]|nr:triose-phosphate isomerase [Gemmatimonadales bacterium]
MRTLLFAANWKMHLGPQAAREFLRLYLADRPSDGPHQVAFFPPAVSLEAVAQALADRPAIAVGVQDVHWEPKGAYTGATSIPLAKEAGATMVLIGHSERRHVFGESEEETGRKLRATLEAGLVPVLCVGELLAEREQGTTEAVVLRQLRAALEGVGPEQLATLVVAYEPVWAIGTGRNATPEDAAAVHAVLRAALAEAGRPDARILYGGSVNSGNVAALLAQAEIDGVLVGGASLDPAGWAALVAAGDGIR